MSNLLDAIYFAATEGIEMPDEWKKSIAKASNAYDELRARLSPEAQELYEAWDRAHGDVIYLETRTIFFRGVRLGLALGSLS